jgi:RNA polymerase-binding transcription factor DksA
MINIDTQKELLLEERKQLEKDLNALGMLDENGGWSVRPDEGDGTHADPVDNADATEDFEEKIARLNVLEKQHVQIGRALNSINAGTYGVCEVSGEQIPEERLDANPSATTTVEHAK